MDSSNATLDGEFIQWPPKDVDNQAFISRSVTLTGFVTFLSLAIYLERGGVSVVISVMRASTLLAAVGLLAVFVLVHELIHGVLFAAFGAKPRFGMVRSGGLPYFYVSGAGARLSKSRFLVVVLAPTPGLTAVGVFLMFAVPSMRAVLVLTLTMHLWGCICDLRMVHLLSRLPKCAEVEDFDNGIRVYVNC